MKKICVITGTRAEYGLLKWLMLGIDKSSDLQLQIIATGMHLSPEFGLTYKEIEKDDFSIDKKIEMLVSSDTPNGISKSIGLGMIGFSDALYELCPDAVVVLGDRFEILSAAISSMVLRIPLIHIHGGEATEGLIDEPIRHSITKMSHLHFVATDEYRKRVIQLGENPKRVIQVGGLGVDSIKKIKLLNKSELEKVLNFKFNKKNLLVTFHPVTLEKNTSEKQMSELFDSLSILKDTNIIFTMPNSDTDGRILFSMINNFSKNNKNCKAFTSLGQTNYFSCLKYVDGVVGNSSSGIIEVPTFKKGTVNIGDRQKGRIKAKSVIDCEPTKDSISKAIKKLYSNNFQHKLENVLNPYGKGGASSKIVKNLEKLSFDGIIKKQFYDIEY